MQNASVYTLNHYVTNVCIFVSTKLTAILKEILILYENFRQRKNFVFVLSKLCTDIDFNNC